MAEGALAVTAATASISAVAIYLNAERMSAPLSQALKGLGTLLIATCQVFAGGGSPTAMYAMLYLWVLLHASLFCSRRAVAAHLGITTLAHLAALTWLGEGSVIVPQLAITLGTQLPAAMIVLPLASRQRELLDLDGFKGFNDDHGHAAGDRVLVDTAAAWTALRRGTDVLARSGGDEFVLVLGACGQDEAVEVVLRMLAATPHGVHCLAGLARWDGRESEARLIARADAALYRAKEAGPLVIAPDHAEAAA